MRKENIKLNAASPLAFLTRDEMELIHSSALELLQDVGAEIPHKGALEMLKNAGCYVKRKRAHIPAHLVEWALKQAPSRIILYDRDGDMAMDLSGRNSYFGTGSDCCNLYDFDTRTHHTFTEQDMINGAKICDSLPNIDFLMCLGLMYMYPGTSYEHQFASMLRNTTKPMVVTAADRTSIKNIAEMVAVVRGGMEQAINKPLIILYDEPTSPFHHTFEAVDKLIYCAENMLPTNYAPAIMMGGTGPMTMEACLIQCLAECLTGLVIHQLAKPGAPFVFGGCITNMDMKCTQPTYSSPESNMCYSMIPQIGRELYRLPTWGMGGACGSKMPDAQAVAEATQQAYISGLSGVNLCHDVGFMNYGLTYSFELLVMMDDVISQLRRVMGGVNMNNEMMAMDVIKKVGPKGYFLSDKHTLTHMKEMWEPRVQDRNDFNRWQSLGSTSMEERAHQIVLDTIANYVPKPLTDKQEAGIQEILERADAESKIKAED
ncbi:MAG: trimethylamine methyltransferase family protein [Lachnospiraceae bacterium]|nr:trimethylamine methyltransferase family protein [Candidatus Equihabitans merdae]